MAGNKGVSRLRDFEIEEVSLVDRPANRRPFLVQKNEGEFMSKTQQIAKMRTDLAVVLENLAAIVTKQKATADAKVNAVDLENVVKGIDTSLTHASALLAKYDGLGEWPVNQVGTADALSTVTSALSDLTSGVQALRSDSAEPELVQALKGIGLVAKKLDVLRAALVKEAEAPVEPKADEPAKPAEATDAQAAAPTEPAADAAPKAEEPAEVKDAAPADAPPADAAPVEAAADAPAKADEAATPDVAKTELIAAFGTVASELENLTKQDEISRDDIEKMGMGMDQVFIRGGFTVDTGDMEMLGKLIGAILGAMDEGQIEKRASRLTRSLTEIAQRAQALSNKVKGMEAPTAREYRELKALHSMLMGLAEKYPAAKTSTKKQDSHEELLKLIDAAVSKALAPLNEKLVKVTAEKTELARQLSKKNEEPVVRGSSPEPVSTKKSVDSNLFPFDYNTEIVQ